MLAFEMPKGARYERHVRLLFAGVFVLTCGVHLVAIVHPAASDASSPLRHAFFAGVNGAFAALFARGVRWVVLPLVPLCLQQGYSHGTDLVLASRRGEVDVQSALVLVFLPLALAYAWRLRSPRPAA